MVCQISIEKVIFVIKILWMATHCQVVKPFCRKRCAYELSMSLSAVVMYSECVHKRNIFNSKRRRAPVTLGNQLFVEIMFTKPTSRRLSGEYVQMHERGNIHWKRLTC